MGHKINPIGFRLKHRLNWNSKWFNKKDYNQLIFEDFLLKNYLEKIYFNNGFITSKVLLNRSFKKLYIYIHLYDFDNFKQDNKFLKLLEKRKKLDFNIIYKVLKKITKSNIQLNIYLTDDPLNSAELFGKLLINELESNNFLNFQKIAKKFIFLKKELIKSFKLKNQNIQYNDVKGLDISYKGCTKVGTMAKTSWFNQSQYMPLHTINANIDYYFLNLKKKAGNLGLKIWIYFK